ncbi:MAG: flavin reductase family protein [Gemmatimonadetes bacterium]|nr:flavin reductase family protein [Gemmatimonadota bacterium]
MSAPTGSPPGVTPDTFRAVLGRFASGVTVVTLQDVTGRPHGMTVSAFTSVSIAPPLVLVCIDRAATMLPLFAASTVFGVNLLASGQADLSRRFADEAMELRFDGVAWEPGPHSAPWLTDAHANLTCQVSQRLTAGDHEILVGHVVAARHADATEPLVYHRGTYVHVR